MTSTEFKQLFKKQLKLFAAELNNQISDEKDNWTIKGFIDIYRNVYSISGDAKVISKILEIDLFPSILKFTKDNGYNILLASHQNYYPDFSFVSVENEKIKFAADLKTSYRREDDLHFINGFTLGSHGAYFRERDKCKNIQFPYNQYCGHFCLGIIYTRTNDSMSGLSLPVERIRSIPSVAKNFQFFVCEKWEIANDRQGSGNTANIGSITKIEGILESKGPFTKEGLGEKWFDLYWMNYGKIFDETGKRISTLEHFLKFKGLK